MNDKPVHEIMVPLEEYPCIADTLSLGDAIVEMAVQILRRKQLTLPRVALVFDESFGELLGMLRRRDIMRGLEPQFLLSGSLPYERKLFDVPVDPNLAELSAEKIVAHLRRRASRLVRDFMRPIPATLRYDDHLMTAIYTMVDRNTSLLPVLQEGKVVGVVRSVDVLQEIALILQS